jgi:PAS domain S-box-containing protein
LTPSNNADDDAIIARTHELSVLVKKVREIEEAILDAAGNDIDAIILDDGDVHVLRQAQKAILAAEQHRQQAEAAIRKSEARFRALIENSGDAITLIDAQGKIVYISPAAERMFGYSLEEIQNQNRQDFVHPDHRLESERIFRELLQKPGASIHSSTRGRHKDGHYIWVEGTISNLLADENVQAMVSNFRDSRPR